MNVKISLLATIGAVALTPAAHAREAVPSAAGQTPAAPAAAAPEAAPPAAAAPAAAPSTTFSPEDIQKFAKAANEVNKIRADATITETDKQARMADAVQAQGLDPQKFNTIAEAARADPALRQKIADAATAKAGSTSKP